MDEEERQRLHALWLEKFGELTEEQIAEFERLSEWLKNYNWGRWNHECGLL